jgi:hypothetical protein
MKNSNFWHSFIAGLLVEQYLTIAKERYQVMAMVRMRKKMKNQN